MRELFKRKIEKKAYIQMAILIAGILFCIFTAFSQKYCLGQNYMELTVNNTVVGAIAETEDPEKILTECRREIGRQSDSVVCMDVHFSYEKKKELFTKIMTDSEAKEKLTQVLLDTAVPEGTLAYTVNIGDFSASFTSLDDVKTFLNGTKAEYDGANQFETIFSSGEDQEENCMEAELSGVSSDVSEDVAVQETKAAQSQGTQDAAETDISAGVSDDLKSMLADSLANPGTNHYETGTLDIQFANLVEVYTSYVPMDNIADVDTAIADVTKEEETNKIYQVAAGDCLSTIAENYNLSLDRLCELNGFTDSNQSIYIDQELIVAVPEPDLSIDVMEGIVYEEDYSENPTIIPNDGWYTTDQVTLQEGVTGHREVNAVVTYENGIEIDRETAHTTVMIQAVPAIIEQGTIIPPTYIKPLSGGRFTSGFGRRWGRMHKGVDWACPIGTTVYASCAGVVEYAGWSSGYGYNVLINHPDGRKTRYAHLSKTLVSAGQSVSQGQTIAKSGSTGRSTGPHLHFEIFINGTQVNPLEYIN